MLRTITDDLWTLEGHIRLSGGMLMPARATFLRLGGDELLVHSPLAIDDETAREVSRIGKVSSIVAPNCMHHLFLRDAMMRWPEARVFGPAGLERKSKGLPFEVLPAEGPMLDGSVAVRRIDGAPSMTEHVFFHPRSRTLLVSDLVFNLHASPGLSLQFFLRLVGAWKKLAQSRVWKLLAKDRAAASQSVHDVLHWDFDRLVMAHGDIVETGAHAELESALAWMRASADAPLLPRASTR
ncbi:DUF4336 domain-containing protein [Pendulispora rubella]|uniref:DUF4336 domain-containing protein n=1 Tax=Pendulispora rubella TaxID=2741070 RepID=A0ABZ2LC10_9BACT